MRRGVALLAVLLLGLVAAVWALRGPQPSTPRDIALAALPLPEERPLRLVIMGTSLTALYDWPEEVARGLEACLGHPVALTLVARPGAQSPWGVEQMPTLAGVGPDIVVLEMAINDADFRDGIWLHDSRTAHDQMVGAITALPGPPQLVMMTMSPATGPRGWVRVRLGAYYAMVADLAAARGLGLLDLYPRWLALPTEARGLEADGLHPDAAVADPLIAGALIPYLAAGRGGTCS